MICSRAFWAALAAAAWARLRTASPAGVNFTIQARASFRERRRITRPLRTRRRQVAPRVDRSIPVATTRAIRLAPGRCAIACRSCAWRAVRSRSPIAASNSASAIWPARCVVAISAKLSCMVAFHCPKSRAVEPQSNVFSKHSFFIQSDLWITSLPSPGGEPAFSAPS